MVVIERNVLDMRLQKGDVNRQDYEAALETLERRYQEMLDRLDGSYQIPTSTSSP